MHELPVIEKIIKIVLKHANRHNIRKVVFINLSVSELSDLVEQWMQQYFDYLSKNTLAEGAKLQIEWRPAYLECNDCKNIFEFHPREYKKPSCPQCGSNEGTLQTGNVYYVKNIGIE